MIDMRVLEINCNIYILLMEYILISFVAEDGCASGKLFMFIFFSSLRYFDPTGTKVSQLSVLTSTSIVID